MGPYPKQRKTSQKKKYTLNRAFRRDCVFKEFCLQIRRKKHYEFPFGQVWKNSHKKRKKKKSVSQILFLTIQNDCV